MKRMIAICSCMLLFCNGKASGFSGSDDFNDNVMDTNWLQVDHPLLTETNHRLVFASTGVGDEAGTWLWTGNSGSYTQDWTVSIDAFNYAEPNSNQWSHAAIAVINNADDGDSFGTVLGTYTDNKCIVASFWKVDDTTLWEGGLPISNKEATLRISYDANTRNLSTSFDVNNESILLTNFNVSAWNMNPNDTFSVAVGGYSENNFAILPGEVYLDNFESSTLPGISNHLYEVEIDHGTESRDPTSSVDDIYDFYVGVLSDTTVSNVIVQCPGGAGITITDSYPDDGGLLWEYSTASPTPTPFFNQFGEGEYIVTLAYTNGIIQSTIIPFAQSDGITPIPAIDDQATFLSPVPLHNALLASPQPVSLTWGNIDPDANTVEIERWIAPWGDGELIGLYSDTWPFDEPTTHPLSTRSIDSLLFSLNDWVVCIGVSYEVWGTNSAGVFYTCAKATESEYHFSVLTGNDDDGDGLANWWEALYFDGPTNAIASLDFDLDGHNNLQESITGMNPTNALSCFAITNSTPLADDFIIEWTSVSGRVYNAYWSTNLLDGFLPMGSDINYPQNSYTDTVHGVDGECFYKVEVRLK